MPLFKRTPVDTSARLAKPPPPGTPLPLPDMVEIEVEAHELYPGDVILAQSQTPGVHARDAVGTIFLTPKPGGEEGTVDIQTAEHPGTIMHVNRNEKFLVHRVTKSVHQKLIEGGMLTEGQLKEILLAMPPRKIMGGPYV